MSRPETHAPPPGDRVGSHAGHHPVHSVECHARGSRRARRRPRASARARGRARRPSARTESTPVRLAPMRRTLLCGARRERARAPRGSAGSGLHPRRRGRGDADHVRDPVGARAGGARDGGGLAATRRAVSCGDGPCVADRRRHGPRDLTGLRPGTAYFYRFRAGRQLSPAGRFETAPAATSNDTVRFGYSGDADATPGANGAPRSTSSGSTRDGRRAQRLQHQPRRHDLLRLRGRRRTGRPHGAGEVGEVPARPRAAGPAQPPRRRRALQPLGRPRVRQRLLAAGVRRRPLRRRREGVHRLRAGPADRGRRPLPLGPLGPEPRAVLPRRALVPRREGLRRPACDNPATPAPRPRADGPAAAPRTRSRSSRPPLAQPGRRPRASTRSATRAARCSAPSAATASCATSARHARRSRSS